MAARAKHNDSRRIWHLRLSMESRYLWHRNGNRYPVPGERNRSDQRNHSRCNALFGWIRPSVHWTYDRSRGAEWTERGLQQVPHAGSENLPVEPGYSARVGYEYGGSNSIRRQPRL